MRKLLLFILMLAALAPLQAQEFTAPVFKDPNNLLEDLKTVLYKGQGPQTDSVWNAFEGKGYPSLTEEQKTTLHRVANNMNYLGFQPRPHFESLLACLSHSKLGALQKGDFLAVLDTAVQIYDTPVASNFLLTTRNLLEFQSLQRTKFNQLHVEGASGFSFRHIKAPEMVVDKKSLPDSSAKLVEEKSEWFKHLEEEDKEKKEAFAKKEEEKKKTEEEKKKEGASKAKDEKSKEKKDDGWDSGWGDTSSDTDTDDGWGDTSSDDGWGDTSTDDGWGDTSTDDGWGDTSTDDDGGWDSGWGSYEEETKTPEEIEAEKKKEEEEERKRKEEEARRREEAARPKPPKAFKLLPDVGEIPEVNGPYIQLEGVTLVIATVYDTFKIENTSGSFLAKNKLFVGEGGRADWSVVGKDPNEMYVEFDQYKFNVKAPVFEAGAVKFHYPAKLDSAIQGEFRYVSKPVTPYSPATFPRFISYNSDVTLKNIAEGVTYRGGLMVRGKKTYSESLQGGPAEITVEREGEKKFRALSKRPFTITDSLIENPQTELVIYQDEDSLTHPGVKLRYSPNEGLLRARKDRKAYKNAPFTHSFHNMDMRGDYLQWDVASDSIRFRMLNSKVPFVLESTDYFDIQRFARLKGLSSFHPLVTVVGYRQEVRQNNFYSAGMASNYNLNPKLVKSAMIHLDRMGFIEYDPDTDWIEVKRKAVRYVRANWKKSDYDNIFIRSYNPYNSNVVVGMDSSELRVNGVQSFRLSDSLNVVVQPEKQEIKVKKNRNIEFTGKMKAGKFIFEGSDFLFAYDSFIVKMDNIARLAFMVPDSVTGELKELDNGMVDTKGVLQIAQPFNKSGLLDDDEFPIFTSETSGKFYFQGDEILNGAYKGDTSIHFDVPPVTIDNINSSDPEDIQFEGEFVSGGIFPPFKQKLKVMPDRSFGFIRDAPEDGFPLYEDKLQENARYYKEIKLDNQGIRGDGRIEYLSGEFLSPDFVFYSDSVLTTKGTTAKIQGGTFNGRTGSTDYPNLFIEGYTMRWLVNQDSMLISNPSPDKPFTIYEENNFDGSVALSPRELSGSGEFETNSSLTASQDFSFRAKNFTSRNSTFLIKSENPKKPALLGERVKVFYNLEGGFANLTAEKARDEIFSFPYLQYRTNLSQGRWDFDKQTVELKAEEDNERQYYTFTSTNPQQYGLEFDAKSAVYNIEDITLNINGVEGINVANVRIVPDGGKVTIKENAEMKVLNDAEIFLNSYTKYHKLTNANIRIQSSRAFYGDAIYSYENEGGDTTLIRFDEFDAKMLTEKVSRDRVDTFFVTTASAKVTEQDQMRLMPGILYKGKMKLVDSKKTPIFNGVASLDLPRENNAWFEYTSGTDFDVDKMEEYSPLQDTLSAIYLDGQVTEAGFPTKLTTGIYLGNKERTLYGTLLEFDRSHVNDLPIFEARGKLTYDAKTKKYTVAPPARLKGETLKGNKFIYDYYSQSVEFEGKLNLLENPRNVTVNAAGIGTGQLKQKEFFINTLIALVFEHSPAAFTYMAADLSEEKGGANGNQKQLETKLAQFVPADDLLKYKRDLLTEEPQGVVDLMPDALVLSDVNLQWSQEHQAFYSIGEVGISNIFKEDLDIRVQGFIEVPKIEDNNILNIYLETRNGESYFLRYRKGNIEAYSSNDSFNNAISNKSSKSQVKLADQEDVQLFIDAFAYNYVTGGQMQEGSEPQPVKEEKKKEEEKKDGF